MRRIIVFESVTLDGVMQAPGRPDEDTRGGFTRGGWAAPYADEVIVGMAAEGTATTDARTRRPPRPIRRRSNGRRTRSSAPSSPRAGRAFG